MLLIKKLLSNRSQIIKQAKFTHCPLGKASEKKTKEQAGALKSLNFSNKTEEFKKKLGVHFHKIK